MVVDQQRPSGVAVIVDMNQAAIAGPNVKLTRLGDRMLHAPERMAGQHKVNVRRTAVTGSTRNCRAGAILVSDPNKSWAMGPLLRQRCRAHHTPDSISLQRINGRDPG